MNKYKWSLLLFLFSGCSAINPELKEAIEYQVAKEIIRIGKKELKKELRAGISLEEYEERRKKLTIRGPEGNLIDNDFIIVTKRGKIRVPKEEAIVKEGVKKIPLPPLKENNTNLSFSVSLNRATLKFGYGNFEIEYKQYYDGEWKAFFEYSMKF